MRRPIITQAWLQDFYAQGVKPKYRGSIKRQATSSKPQAQPEVASDKLQAASLKHNLKLQAPSNKLQAPSEDRYKLQASSDKQQAS